MTQRNRSRLAVAFVGALAVLYAQQFLSVHELKHLFATDASHCEFAPMASVGSGAILPVTLTLTAPPAEAPAFPGLALSAYQAPAPMHQARSPPRV